jgi:predicted CXXCH cytochrome family protein
VGLARILVLVPLAACGGSTTPAAQIAPGKGPVASNILRGDYAGSASCADCHGAVYTTWESSPMRNMTRDAAAATIRAPFVGATLTVGSDTCTMETEGHARFMRVVQKGQTSRFRVTKVVGGRYREDFVGVDVTGDGDPVTSRGHGPEHVLPATFVFSTQSWRYKGYSVMVKERPAMSAKGVWAQECISCHNTLPYATMLYDELYGPSLPPYQGKLSDRLTPKNRAWGANSRDDAGLANVLASEIEFLGETAPMGDLMTMLPAAARASEKRLDGAHLVELGIGCEACHNGSKEHAVEPTRLPTFEVQSKLVGITPPRGQSGTRAQWINHTCAKCHTVLFSHYPWTWEGGERNKNPGGSSISSGEGRDYQLGGCASQMACTTCHDPHTVDPTAKLRELATPAGNHLCVTCHDKFAALGAVEQHSHHKTGSEGTSCIACHMAKKNMGLDYGLIRYHRIGSPTDPKRVLADRPVECAVCHADKSVETLVSTMEQWWTKRYDRARLQTMYGDLSANAMYATLERGKPHEQAVAIAILGEVRDRNAIAPIAKQLDHDYPLVRYYALHALETITGSRIAIDVGAPAADVRVKAADWLTTAK